MAHPTNATGANTVTRSGDFIMPTEDLPPPPPQVRDPVPIVRPYLAGDQVRCPSCGGAHVKRRSWITGKPFVWWACLDSSCGFWWKAPASVMTVKVHVVV
jgi:hypothetical protein